MAYRTFVDRDGEHWQVWDSQPMRMEHRHRADRRQIKRFPWRGVERRSGTERRVVSQHRIMLSGGYGSGWLTFESLQEKRRLIPIPTSWEDLEQAGLRVLCGRAKRVAKLDNIGAA